VPCCDVSRRAATCRAVPCRVAGRGTGRRPSRETCSRALAPGRQMFGGVCPRGLRPDRPRSAERVGRARHRVGRVPRSVLAGVLAGRDRVPRNAPTTGAGPWTRPGPLLLTPGSPGRARWTGPDRTGR